MLKILKEGNIIPMVFCPTKMPIFVPCREVQVFDSSRETFY